MEECAWADDVHAQHMMSKQAQKTILMGALILLGASVILSAAQFPKNPGSINPGFYPTLTAVLLIGFSVLELVQGRKDPENEPAIDAKKKRQNLIKLVNIILSMLVCVLVMQYLSVLIAISLFLLYYLKYIAKLSWKNSIVIAAVGTVVLYIAILLLKIPL